MKIMTGKLSAARASSAPRLVACCCVLLCALGGIDARADDGDLDETFGVGGRIAMPWAIGTPIADEAVAVLSQTNGTVILVGNVNIYSGFDDQDGNPINSNGIGISRQLVNGQLDTSFGSGGSGRFLISNDPRAEHAIHAYTAALDRNGRILIAGYDLDDNLPRQSAAIWAVKPDGSALDASFGNGGEYIMDRGGDFSLDAALSIYAPSAADIQAGTLNDFLISGVINDNGDVGKAFIGAVSSTGAFVNSRIWWNSLGGTDCDSTTANALAFRTMPDRSYAGYTVGDKVCGSDHSAQLTPFHFDHPSGFTFDPPFDFAFGGTGMTNPSAATSIAIDDAKRAVVAGYLYSPDLHTPKNMAVARLSAAGFDFAFGVLGTTIIDWGSLEYTWVNAVRIQSNGKVMLGGNEMLMLPGVPAQGAFALVRLQSNGAPDTGFGNRLGVSGTSDYGFAVDGVASPMPRVSAMSFTEGENILLAGYVEDPAASQNTFYAVMRIRNGPIDDTIFRNGFDD